MNTIAEIEVNSSDEAYRAAAGGWARVEVYQAQRCAGTPQMEENAARRVLDGAGLGDKRIPVYQGVIVWRKIDMMVAEAKYGRNTPFLPKGE